MEERLKIREKGCLGDFILGGILASRGEHINKSVLFSSVREPQGPSDCSV